jgi:glycerol-3-phosphate acyltransferase PlsY
MLAAIAALSLMIFTVQPVPYILLAILGAAYITLRHRRNIERLLAGTEPRSAQSSSAPRSDRID